MIAMNTVQSSMLTESSLVTITPVGSCNHGR